MLGCDGLLGRESIEVLYCGWDCVFRLWMFCDDAGPPAVDGRVVAGRRLFTGGGGIWLDSIDVVVERLDPLRIEPCDIDDWDL